jgi:hypothetical protein
MGELSQSPDSDEDLVQVTFYMPRKLRDELHAYKLKREKYRRTKFQDIIVLACRAYLARRNPPKHEAA